MRFGLTEEQRREKKQRILKEHYGKWFKKFALFPTKMTNGTWVWLEFYEYNYNINRELWFGKYTYYGTMEVYSKRVIDKPRSYK